jgi:hypothetical protein
MRGVVHYSTLAIDHQMGLMRLSRSERRTAASGVGIYSHAMMLPDAFWDRGCSAKSAR